MNKKGFTLIELLAVIAILAIIMLIATPMVLNTITKSKEDAAKQSAKLAWSAAELYIANQTTSGAAIVSPATLTEVGPYLEEGNVNSVSFTIANGVITGSSTVIENGTSDFTCAGATKAAITCS